LSLPLAETPPSRLIAADRAFWPAVADELLALRERSQSQPGADFRGIDVIVPGWSYAPLLRAALQGRLALAGWSKSIPPRIHTIASWAGEIADDTLERRIELFSVLRTNGWVRSAFGEQPVALWNLAALIASVCDELTFAALEGTDAFEARLNASLARHFTQRAARAVQPQAQLVLQLWRASLAQGTATSALLASLQARSRAAARPLLYVSMKSLEGWTGAWLGLLAKQVPVRIVRADVAAAAAKRPLLAAAWPELLGRGIDASPIAGRTQTVDMVSATEAPTLIEATSLEDEATAIADQVVAWLRSRKEGDDPIALVALDRIAARRVRALLERAQVRVRDETGWKLSTTSAAAVVMRLFDLALSGFDHRDLLDWLKSPFTLHGRTGKRRVVRAIERTIRERAPGQGVDALLRALGEGEHAVLNAQDRATAERWLRELQSHAARLGGGAAPAGALMRALDAAMRALGMRDGLGADPVGIAALRELDELLARFSADRGLGAIRLAPLEFRALIGGRFEEVAFAGEAFDSPVVMVSLSAAAMRDFDAAILIGADSAHLPALPPDVLFLSRSVRMDLGLPGVAEALRDQLADLAAVLLRVPRVIVTWRSREGDEPRALAAWLTRLRAVAQAAGVDSRRTNDASQLEVAVAAMQRPAPRAPHRLPAAISATHYQSLVDCPYQFYARYMLGLRPLEEISDEPRTTDFGLAVHQVLARFHIEWSERDLRAVAHDELAASLAAHAAAVLDPLVERRPRLFGLRSQFAETQAAYLSWLRERVAQGWSFKAAEHDVRVAIELDVAGAARTIELFGRIDRIDVRGDDTEVLDYKTTRRDKLAERLRWAGEHIQLPFYGLLLSPRPSRAAFVYMQRVSTENQAPVGPMPPPQEYALLVDAVGARLRSDLARLAAGAAMPALGNDTTCSYCKMRGLCRRDYWQDAEGQ
jgi:ATP-dependent helicase/nuclease subunit B